MEIQIAQNIISNCIEFLIFLIIGYSSNNNLDYTFKISTHILNKYWQSVWKNDPLSFINLSIFRIQSHSFKFDVIKYCKHNQSNLSPKRTSLLHTDQGSTSWRSIWKIYKQTRKPFNFKIKIYWINSKRNSGNDCGVYSTYFSLRCSAFTNYFAWFLLSATLTNHIMISWNKSYQIHVLDLVQVLLQYCQMLTLRGDSFEGVQLNN